MGENNSKWNNWQRINFQNIQAAQITQCQENKQPNLKVGERPKQTFLQGRYAMLCYAKSLQSCPTLCDPIDGSPPGSPVPGILQARTLEWVAISFPNAWKWKVKVKSLSRVWLCVTPWTAAYQAPASMGFSRQEYWSWVSLPSPPRKIYRWLTNTWKYVQHCSLLEKCKSTLHWDIASDQSLWPSSQSLQMLETVWRKGNALALLLGM